MSLTNSLSFDGCDKRQGGWNLKFTALVTNSDWIRVIDHKANSLSSGGVVAWELGGFDFGDEPQPLQTRPLTVADRQALEALELF